jgi:hypothetical protein
MSQRLFASERIIRILRDAAIDAIRLASFLRSKVFSHKMKELASSLNSYDIENVKHLARRLLLETLGFWPLSQHLCEAK